MATREQYVDAVTIDANGAVNYNCACLSEMVLIEWIPESYRSAHVSVGKRGAWPCNGSERLLVEQSCADHIVESSAGWATIVR